MNVIIKAIAGVLIAIVLCQVLAKQGKDISVLLLIAVCCIVVSTAIAYLRPVVDFIRNLQSIGQLNTEMISVLFKAVGITLLTEITSMICSDMGNTSLGKSLQILSLAVILWLSLPLFEQLLALLDNILGSI